jgi:O-acetyl-ADP-ribose deacetylase (regulator of RNase III)
MSTIKLVKGNLLDAKEQFVCHQCNCVTRWAAHLAKDVFQRFPHADVYPPRIPLGYRDQPGTIKVCGDGNDQRFVIAMFAQVYPGSSKAGYTSDVDSIPSRARYFKECLDKMANGLTMASVAFPWQIGCGAAGGDWGTYVDMICDFSDKTIADVTIYKLPGL